MELTVGQVVEGKVKSITNFGAFISLPDNKTGMVHISEVANAYVSDIRQHLSEGQAVKVMVIGTEGGILHAIVGSAWYTAIACGFGAVLGIATAVYQVCYCRSSRISSAISLVMQCMAGVPSIVMGLFGYSLLVLALGWGKCILAGGITQGIMILPFIQVRAEKALREVDPLLIRASYSLGVSRAYTIRKLVLGQCLPQLVSGVILGGCHAMGAAAPLIFTGAVIMSKVPKSVMKPAMALPYHLYMLLTQGTSSVNAERIVLRHATEHVQSLSWG